MGVSCEKCGKTISVEDSEYVYYQNRMMFACKSCAKKINEEIKCAQRVCTAVNGKKKQAESVLKDKDAFDNFLKDIDLIMKKIPVTGNLSKDIPLLVSLVKNYVSGEYKEISYNSIIAVVATLLYVISPLDIIPDLIPIVGFSDDAMAVAFCIKMIHDDLNRYKAWYNKKNSII